MSEIPNAAAGAHIDPPDDEDAPAPAVEDTPAPVDEAPADEGSGAPVAAPVEDEAPQDDDDAE